MTTYYISPSGNDSNSGTYSSPWYTFTYAIPKLVSGDTLLLMNGTYTSSTTGLLSIVGGVNANNGTSSQPITIKSQNERQAFLQSDSTTNSFYMEACSYWNIEGLHFESDDFTTVTGNAVFTVYNSNNINLRRLLGAKSNRYGNYHIIELSYSNNILVEECEIYDFHRHGILDWYGHNNTFRRNYINSRNYPDIPGGYPSSMASTGDEGIGSYPSYSNIIENNIVENIMTAFGIHGTDPNLSDNNIYLGNISINGLNGFEADGRYGNIINNIQYINNISINCHWGFTFTDSTGIIINHATILNLTTYLQETPYGIYSNLTSTSTGTLSLNNILISSSIGTAIAPSNINLTMSYIDIWGIPVGYQTSTPLQIDPNLGSCIVWIPSGSSIKSVGSSGTDIGADILYRYINGVLTNQPLWNPTTGEFPHGTIISGVNDIAGLSAFDVHMRLNINSNGCSFPPGYSISSTGNLLSNPGFEMGQSPWTTRQSGTLASFSFIQPGRLGGTSSYVTYSSLESGKYGEIDQAVYVQSNTTYTLSGWIKTNNIIGTSALCSGASVSVNWLDSAGIYTGLTSDMIASCSILGTQGWTYYTGTVTSPSNASYAQVALSMYDSSGESWFDDIFFGIPPVITPTPTPPTPPVCPNPTCNLVVS